MRDVDDADWIPVEHLVVQSFLRSNGTSYVFALELDPDMPVRVLLDVNTFNLSEFGADRSDLVLDVHEEGRVFPQVHLRGIKHA